MILVPPPPTEPSSAWLESFSVRLMMIKPGIPRENSILCGRLAYPGAWLLEPDEAADLWMAAIESAARDKVLRGLRR